MATPNYYMATDGVFTIFRRSYRIYTSAWIHSTQTPGARPLIWNSGFSRKSSSYKAVQITATEYNWLIRNKATKGTAPRDSWLRNADVQDAMVLDLIAAAGAL